MQIEPLFWGSRKDRCNIYCKKRISICDFRFYLRFLPPRMSEVARCTLLQGGNTSSFIFFSQPSWFQSQDYWNLRHPCFSTLQFVLFYRNILGYFFSLGYFLVAKFCVLKFLHGFHKVNSGSRLLFPVLLDMLFIHESTLVIAA